MAGRGRNPSIGPRHEEPRLRYAPPKKRLRKPLGNFAQKPIPAGARPTPPIRDRWKNRWGVGFLPPKEKDADIVNRHPRKVYTLPGYCFTPWATRAQGRRRRRATKGRSREPWGWWAPEAPLPCRAIFPPDGPRKPSRATFLNLYAKRLSSEDLASR